MSPGGGARTGEPASGAGGMEVLAGSTRLVLIRGDLTQQDVDAIVNAANSGLLGGGGVDGAIHRAGGPGILEECRAIRAERGECPAGQAVVTGGGDLKARYVIHAVGPVWRGGERGEDGLLQSAYLNSLRRAVSLKIRSVAFPCISTGAYGFPIERAARLAFDAVSGFVRQNPGLEEIRFVVFSQRDLDAYAPLFKPA